MRSGSAMLTFLRDVGRLKALKRSGWLLYGLGGGGGGAARVESVADHTARTALAALVLAPPERAARVAQMALVHDLAEAYVGDITPVDGVPAVEKYRRERNALHRMVRHLDPHTAREITQLWEEFEAGVSVDANLVREVDKLELLIQADEYERQSDVDLQPFFDSTQGVFRHPDVRNVVAELHRQRDYRRADDDGATTDAKVVAAGAGAGGCAGTRVVPDGPARVAASAVLEEK